MLHIRAYPRPNSCAHSLDEFTCRIRRPGLGPACVQPPSIAQYEIAIEPEEIRGTDRAVGTRDFLRLVVEVGKSESSLECEPCHVRKRILRITHCVIGIDRDQRHTLILQRLGILDEANGYRLHVGAMIADEDHHRAIPPPYIGQLRELSMHIL